MQNLQDNNEEITLKVLYLKGMSVFRYLLSKWPILLIAAIVGGGIGYYLVKNRKPIYIAKLTFVLSGESKGGGLSGLASQFGLDMGGNASDVFSGDNILTLFKSKRMIKEVMFKKPPGSNDILANIIVKEWMWDKSWKSQKRTQNQFPFPTDVTTLTPIQDSLFREVYSMIIAGVLTVARTDKRLSIYEVNAKSTNEIFACYLTRFLMDATAKFYIETKTSIAKLNLRMLQREADSLRGALGGAISSTAAETDRTFALNPALQAQRAPAQKSQVRSVVLTAAYGEIVKNLELAKISLQKEMPLYQIIDVPEMPMKITKTSKTLYVIYGAAVMFFLTAALLLIRKKIISFSK